MKTHRASQERSSILREISRTLCLILCAAALGFSASDHLTFITFDPPASVSTLALGINSAMAVTGYYQDASNVYHGFLRLAGGTFTTFDVPGAIGTFAYGIDDVGLIVGTYEDASLNVHGFVRAPGGVITTFH